MSEHQEIPVAQRIDNRLGELKDRIDSNTSAATATILLGSIATGGVINGVMEHNVTHAGNWGAFAVGGLTFSAAFIRDIAISRRQYHDLEMERLKYPEYAPQAPEPAES